MEIKFYLEKGPGKLKSTRKNAFSKKEQISENWKWVPKNRKWVPKNRKRVPFYKKQLARGSQMRLINHHFEKMGSSRTPFRSPDGDLDPMGAFVAPMGLEDLHPEVRTARPGWPQRPSTPLFLGGYRVLWGHAVRYHRSPLFCKNLIGLFRGIFS